MFLLSGMLATYKNNLKVIFNQSTPISWQFLSRPLVFGKGCSGTSCYYYSFIQQISTKHLHMQGRCQMLGEQG